MSEVIGERPRHYNIASTGAEPKSTYSADRCPHPEISPQERNRINYFAYWCRERGVRALRALPTTIAAFIKSEAEAGITGEAICNSVAAIELAHAQDINLANPVATAVVRYALGEVLDIEAPRSWPKADRPLFMSLPLEVRSVIKRRQDQDSTELRRLQNKVSAIAQKGNLQCQHENKSTAASTDLKPTTPSS